MNQMTQPALRAAAAQATSSVLRALLESDAKKASVFLSDKLVVSACRRFKADRRSSREDYVLKIGAPNYLEREFLRACKAADEPLPLRKVQLKFWPTPRK